MGNLFKLAVFSDRKEYGERQEKLEKTGKNSHNTTQPHLEVQES
jgi:hypothetical protein